MDEQAEVYKPLGSKTLAIFVLQRIGVLFVFAAAVFISLIVARTLPPDYAALLHRIAGGIAAMGIVVFAVIFVVAYVTYTRYSITLTADDLKMTRGFINEEEIGIPYRRIQDALIERDVADQVFGTSDIVIHMAYTEVGGSQGNASVLVLPSIDKDIAAHIQSEIVKRAEIEEIHVEPNAMK